MGIMGTGALSEKDGVLLEDSRNKVLQLITQGITEKVSPWQQLKPGEAGEELGVTFAAQPRLGDGQGGQPSQLGQQGNTLNMAMQRGHNVTCKSEIINLK